MLIIPHPCPVMPTTGPHVPACPEPPPTSFAGADYSSKACNSSTWPCPPSAHLPDNLRGPGASAGGGNLSPLLMYRTACETPDNNVLQGWLWWRGCCSSPARAQRAASSSWEPWRSCTGLCCRCQSCLCRCTPKTRAPTLDQASKIIFHPKFLSLSTCGTACHGV